MHLVKAAVELHVVRLVEADVELGGTDQKFNVAMGRDMQRLFGKRLQFGLLLPILIGLDGLQKMSKSLGNYIGIDEAPQEIFGKVMSIPDSMILPYFDWLTDTPTTEIIEIEKIVSNAVPFLFIKLLKKILNIKSLIYNIVYIFH